MPKLYKSIKVEQGLKIGLREPSGSEWFADMTIDRDRRTCRKIKLRFDPTDKENVIEAQKKAKALYRSFKKEIESIDVTFFSIIISYLRSVRSGVSSINVPTHENSNGSP